MTLTPGSSTSKRSRLLAAEIVRLVEEFREKEPRTRDEDVQRALMLAKSRLVGTGSTLVLAIVGLVVLIGALIFYASANFGR